MSGIEFRNLWKWTPVKAVNLVKWTKEVRFQRNCSATLVEFGFFSDRLWGVQGGGGREVPSPPSRPIRLHLFLSPSQPFTSPTSPQTTSAKALDKTVFDFNNTCSLWIHRFTVVQLFSAQCADDTVTNLSRHILFQSLKSTGNWIFEVLWEVFTYNSQRQNIIGILCRKKMLKRMSSDTKVTDKQEIMHLDGFRGL